MKFFRRLLTDLTLVAAAIAVAVLLLMAALYLAHYPAHRILGTWLNGALGTRTDVLISLNYACPLILTGLAAGVAFRSGVFNIGAEGQSILGAIFTTALATRFLPALPAPIAIPLAIVAAGIGGAAWAFIAAILDRLRGVPIVLSTILLNFIALKFLGILVEGPLKAVGPNPQSDTLPTAFFLPGFFASAGGALQGGFFIALAIAAVCWVVQSRTTFGFEILVTGLNPVAAQYAGMPVAARQFAIMLWSGAFAGIAGAIQIMGVEGGHFLGTSPTSYGYAGIAVALLGRLHPAGIVAAAIFFGMLDHGATAIDFPLPPEVADIVKGILVLVILVGTAALARRRLRVTQA